MFKAVIFDFDGIIADTEGLHYRAISQILDRYGIELTKEDYYRDYLGYTDRDFFTKFIGMYPEALSTTTTDALVEDKSVVYLGYIKGRSCIIKSVPGFIKMLAKHSIPIAICSGGRRNEIEQILLKGKLLEFFEVLVSADEVAAGKPDPEGFLLTLKLLAENHAALNIEAADCVVIEDSRWGIAAAKGAGMHTIAVTTSYTSEELSAADLVVSSLKHVTIEDLAALCT